MYRNVERFYIRDKCFTIEQLNKIIGCFDYGYFNRSKPSPITRPTLKSDNNSLRVPFVLILSPDLLSLLIYFFYIIARQMWYLGNFFPLVIGGAIPNDDEKWQHFFVAPQNYIILCLHLLQL